MLKIITLFLAAAVIFISPAYAQETDIPEKLLPIAEELGCATKTACASSFNANFSKGLELAEKYDIYDAEQKTLAKSFKTEVLTNLASASEADFEQKIIEIASNLVKNKPSLARRLGVDTKEVKAAQTIVTELKNVGANLAVCSRPADTLAREELITCLNASRKLADRADEVKIYIPEKNLTTATKAFDLEESLRRGEYGNLGATADEVGMKCLQPDSPAICDEIASRFFGAQGVKMLKEARTQVTQVEKTYRQTVKDYTFTTPDGQTLVGKDAIGQACERAFKEKNIALARACGEFAVRNGFASQKDVDRALQIAQAVVDNNADVDICSQNPAACQTYIPDELRNEFDVMREIDDIMRKEMGFDPMQCQWGAANPEIGKRCLEGSKRALPLIKAISAVSKEAQRIVADIEKHIAMGEQMEKQKEKIKQELTVAGGPGGCKSEEECRAFCMKPENGPECLAFGAKKGFYREGEVAQRFEMYNQNQQFIAPPQQVSPMYPTTMPMPIMPMQTMAPGTLPNYMTGGGTGPSPECFAAIQSGDFEKARSLCAAPQPMPATQAPQPGQYQQPYYQQPCPMIFPAPCPMGQHREQQMVNNCSVFGPCVPDQGTGVQQPMQQQPCAAVPPCPSGQYHPTEFNGCLRKECITSQWQPPVAPVTPITPCTGSQIRCYGPGSPEGWCQVPPCPMPPATETCPSGNIRCTDPAGGSWCQMPPCPAMIICPTGQMKCYSPNNPNGWCQVPPCPSGEPITPPPTTPVSCTGSQIRCYSATNPQGWCQMPPCPMPPTTETCPSGNVRCSDSTGGSWCQMPPCPPITTPPSTTPTACTGGQIRCYSSPSDTAGWCQMSPCPPMTTTPTPSTCSSNSYTTGSGACNYATCPSGCTFTTTGCPNGCITATTICGNGVCDNGETNISCPNDCGTTTPPPTTPTACPTNQVRCFSGTNDMTGWCQMSPCPPMTTPTTPTACPTNQVRCFSGTNDMTGWCQMSPCPPMTTPTTPTACSNGQIRCYSGYNDMTGWCQMSPCPSTTTTPPPTGSCASDQVRCYSGSGDTVGWCQMPPCPSTTPPPTETYTPPPTETYTPPPTETYTPPPTETYTPPPTTEPPPPTTPPPGETPPPTSLSPAIQLMSSILEQFKNLFR